MRIAITISAAILDLCLRKTRSGKSPDYRDVIVFEELSARKRKADIFKFPQFEERIRKAKFS